MLTGKAIVNRDGKEWRHFVKICKTAPVIDIVVLVLTFVLTVVFDLVVAIEVGMVITLIAKGVEKLKARRK